MDQLNSLVQAGQGQPPDEFLRSILSDWLEERGDYPATQERLVARWPGEQGGRWYWWRETMTQQPAYLGAKLPAEIFDALPGGFEKRSEGRWYRTPLDAFPALHAALRSL